MFCALSEAKGMNIIMKKTIKAIAILFTLVFVFATMIPITTHAKSKNAETLDKLTVEGIKKYDKPLPKNGKKVTRKQWEKERSKRVKDKLPGKGKAVYYYCLRFTKSKGAKKGQVNWAQKKKEYYLNDDKNFNHHYIETKHMGTELTQELESEMINKTECVLWTEDKKNHYDYRWVKGEKTGTLSKSKKAISKQSSAIFLYEDMNADVCLGAINKNYKIYKDATVLGQKCMVYSYDYNAGKENGGKTTWYCYVSKQTGATVKQISVSHNDGGSTTYIYFETKMINKKASFFKPPKSVTFEKVNL